ncbi:hypothetical protein SAMN05660964_03144 [Thiothrix caldifontis]|uniref:Uncharacterized protein n=1 Tax=Thiothrix caldifontis TaxID=525918 RepID=A0A1H4FUP6_9GAMM|nr:hypothetical protein [Thiothrix caldifontis]SEB01073.1 hypothetical protein SAMN05660964_03144 [Thiothrix caldifontis]
MTPEEKARIEAETEKLIAETSSIKKGGWGKPSAWIPMLAAITAIATSIGQFQYSSLKEREDALEAREKVFEAKVEEGRLIEKNNKLEVKSQELIQDIQKSTSEILLLKEEITKANEQLLKIAKEKDTDGTLVASVEKEISKRTEQVTNIVTSAESRNLEVQIQNLVWKMNSDVKEKRLAAVAELIEDHKENQIAISSAISLITMPQLETLSSSGRINVFVYLRNTEQSSWNEDLRKRAQDAIHTIKKMTNERKLNIGPQMEGEIHKLEEILKKNS